MLNACFTCKFNINLCCFVYMLIYDTKTNQSINHNSLVQEFKIMRYVRESHLIEYPNLIYGTYNEKAMTCDFQQCGILHV